MIIGDDDPAAQKAMVEKQGLAGFPFINNDEIGRLFEVDKLPHAVLLDASGTVLAKGLVNSREHFESLIISHEMGVHSVQDYIAGLPTPAKVDA
jgi:methylamine dehydrogenase accessory protein MauD